MDNPLVRLRRFIAAHYDAEEFRTLCFDLGVSYDELRGEGLSARVRELVLYLGRRERFEPLLQRLSRERPDSFDLDTGPAALKALYAALPTFQADDLQAEIAQLRQALSSLAQLGVPTTEVQGHLTALKAQLVALGPIAGDHGAAVGRDVDGDVVTGVKATGVDQRRQHVERQIVVSGDLVVQTQTAADPDLVWQAISHRPPPQDLRRATERYLTYLVDGHRYLSLKGMGVSDRVPLRLALAEMYVPLKARVELPEGETWSRHPLASRHGEPVEPSGQALRLAGREVSDEEDATLGERLSASRPVLDLLRGQGGLILLGDPGAGKTTFLKYLALGLATGQGERLDLGVHLPVLAPLSAYANALATRDVSLNRFIAAYYGDLGVDLPIGPMLDEALAQGGALVLLDGLDEVQDPAQRGLVAERVVDFYAFHRRAGNKFVLTSRVVGYREVRPTTVEGLVECTLVDFEDAEIETFVTRWTATLERAAHGDTDVAAREAAREERELLAAIRDNPGVRRLAANPLLLTILALMKRQDVTLPERRVELYDQYVRTLLSSWNRARGLGRPPARDLDVVETVRILAPLALWMHETSPGAGLVKRGELQRELVEIYRQRGEAEPERAGRRFLADVREHASLLLERGAGQYGFIHLTFEEYLAAVGVARLGQRDIAPVVDLLAEHIDSAAWREVTLLAVGYLGIVQQQEEVADDVVAALLEQQPGEPGRALALAGHAVADAWPGGVTLTCKEQVTRALVRAVGDDGRVAPPLRADAGRALGRLGDPRPGVGLNPETGLPDMVWCPVPAGPFTMGEKRGRHSVELSSYLISRYPVTNAQFAAFVKDGGYGVAELWREAAQAGWWEGGWFKGRNDDNPRDRPFDYGPPFNLPNHPVVGVTWYEAVAFCRWLGEKWKVASGNDSPRSGAGGECKVWVNGEIKGLETLGNTQFKPLADAIRDTQHAIRLPTEAEWEKAARGIDERAYPWEGEFDAARCNVDATGIGATSAVGMFPSGASPYGLLDMAGNVWEWVGDWYSDYPSTPQINPTGPETGEGKVLRGGAWYYPSVYARSASRVRYRPDDQYGSRGFRCVVAPTSSSL